MLKYKIFGDGVQDTESGALIPKDPSNRHWQEYVIWAQENTAAPQFTKQELDDIAWLELRQTRDRLLNATDFMMCQDYYNKMTSQEQIDVIVYRESLRTLPTNTEDPHNPTWPTKPQIVIDNNI